MIIDKRKKLLKVNIEPEEESICVLIVNYS